MVARATAPNRVGPGSVFPDASKWDSSGTLSLTYTLVQSLLVVSDGLKSSLMASAPFWVALISQLIIVFGYLWFYRKEQLQKP